MGLDFITTCAKQFQKSWDRGRRELSEPQLFTDIAREQRQTFAAFPRHGVRFVAGKKYEIAIENDRVVMKEGIDTIGDFPSIPQFAMDHVRANGCDSAVGYVHRVHEVSGAADVTFR